jgi:O-antigen ligase
VLTRGGDRAGPATLALGCLVALASLTPWALGGAPPLALRLVTAVALGTSALALSWAALGRGADLPAVALWPPVGFLVLVLAQLVPLPAKLHAALAAGSYAVWHPAGPAAAVLGAAPRPVSLDPRSTLLAAGLVTGLALLAVLAAPLLGRERAATRAASVIAAAGFALAAYAIVARARFGSLLYGSIRVPTVFPFGPFVNKNHFAGWAAMAFPIAAGLAVGLATPPRVRGGRDWTTGPRAPAVVLALVAALALGLATLVSLSRGGVFALLAGALALAALLVPRSSGSRPARTLAPAALLVGVLAVVAFVQLPAAAHDRLSTLTGAAFRLETWRDTLRLASASPFFGSGLGAFHDAYPRFKSGYGTARVEHAESEYLETLAETGVCGLAFALAALFLLLRAAAARRGMAPRGVAWAVGGGGAAALVAVAAHGLVDFDLRLPSNAALAALAASAAAALAGTRPRPLPRPACAVLAAAVLVLLAAAVVTPPRPFLAREELRLAAETQTAQVRELRLARAEAAAAAAVRRRPADAESWLLLAYARAARGEVTAAELARHAADLDPRRPGVGDSPVLLGPGGERP